MAKKIGGESIYPIGTSNVTDAKVKTKFRKPNKEDGAAVWELVDHTGVLDLNSSYSYIMWCEIFNDTSIVAEKEGKIVGFISGFLHPNTRETLFIWQVAVHESQQGQGLATKMLFELLNRGSEFDQPIKYLEATVSPSNTPSNHLFWGLANKLDSNCVISDYILAEDFPAKGHEEEILFRIGPIK